MTLLMHFAGLRRHNIYASFRRLMMHGLDIYADIIMLATEHYIFHA